MVQDTFDYYEDTHGNKIIGPHRGCKWVFSGLNSVIKVGKNPDLSGSEFYVHNDVKIEIGDNCRITDAQYYIEDGAELQIGSGFTMARKCEFVIGVGTAIVIGEDWIFSHHIFCGVMMHIVFLMSVPGKT